MHSLILRAPVAFESVPRLHMHPTAPTWSTGDPGLPRGERAQQDSANAPFAQEAPPSKGSKSKRLKPAASGRQLIKSLSTPQLRGPSTMSDSDKNRNRLGYQRTTIACGECNQPSWPYSLTHAIRPVRGKASAPLLTLVPAHCRRRKIRCVVSEDEPQQKCVNCIRLKRECVFYPVDQQTALDAQSESSSRTSKVRSTASSRVSTSPTQSSTRTLGGFDQHHGTHQGSRLEAQPSMPGVPILPSTNLAEPGGFVASAPQMNQSIPGQYVPPLQYPTQQGYESQTWEPLDRSGPHPHQTRAPMENVMGMHPAYSAYSNPALQVDTAPFPGVADTGQPHPQYPDGGLYRQQSPMAVPQQWQQHPQQERSQVMPQYHHQDIYHPSPQQEHQPPLNFALGSNPPFMPMAPGHSPQPFQHHPHSMQPQNSQFPPGYYVPTNQAPMQWHTGQPPTSFNDGRQARHPDDHAGYQ